MQGQTREHLQFCFHLHPKEALLVCFFFRYCYMALILKCKSFGFADMEHKEEKHILCVSHGIRRHHHLAYQQLF